MIFKEFKHLATTALVFLFSGCSFQAISTPNTIKSGIVDSTSNGSRHQGHEGRVENLNRFLKSGTVTLSFSPSLFKAKSSEYAFQQAEELNQDATVVVGKTLHVKAKEYAPLIGFFPVSASFNPADNEIWLELNKEKSTLSIFKGSTLVQSFGVQGNVSISEGQYPLQHKQKDPLWYAPDEYFEKRRLRVPPKGDHFRYRKGALGSYALYPTMEFVIHSGPFWTSEIGGLKARETDLASIFALVPLGAPIIVK